ncbi:hypothetical protein AB833_09145 [Chromatiales bacterium (ex Bugula neritina AB1)]|nr:hypothetical protein AB833_09145 [Chromatiales bacterium (ex Bugula neritina AB1)]
MPKPVCWIDEIDYPHANSKLRAIYDQVLSPGGQLDNLYRGFSLSPQTILPADNLYKAVLHDSDNVLAKSFAELIGTYVAILSGCDYAKAHHGQNFVALSEKPEDARRILNTLGSGSTEDCGTSKEIKVLEYVRKLCLQPAAIEQSDVEVLQADGWSDTEISEIVQVVAMFSYYVRVINGVGIQLGDEKLGLY